MNNQLYRQWYYKIAYFLVANQVVFKRLFVVLLILLNIILWWVAGVGLINYWVRGDSYNKMLTSLGQNLINWDFYHAQNRPQSLEIVLVNKIKTSLNKYDLVAKVHNPNLDWHIREVNYAFVVDGFVLDWQSVFVLPGQDKYLFHFSYFSQSNPEQVDLKIGHINWQRVREKNRLEIVDDILVENKKLETNKNISQIKFDATNNTHFSFWQVGWQIVLYQGQRPMATNYVTTHSFVTGEKRKISATWIETLGGNYSTEIEIIVDIDIFDDSNYMTETEIPPVNLIRGAVYPPPPLEP